ncbi:hypothetical protein PPL_00333 [Heterostelium album PN500]|uniref:COG4 transport protein middle alpha-helical bundle domain-containing protein n=1 Tax=Heterostelium pallidum (strain ATCC 26659 / Pp 5 / PN500) TaxID=670386 RepID=D3AW62_HETP5|nr:hypothetical protein PPL_00333 [Heterostelium album PN500]EFA86535.1 hypothetical protein PPL_00333 [Heterostelium album PN500]|eukprot:XP_020438640.1 hypothetical protein PPL_00333 [Heterostelium album PN500]
MKSNSENHKTFNMFKFVLDKLGVNQQQQQQQPSTQQLKHNNNQQQQLQPQNKQKENNDIVDDLSQFLHSMNVNKSQSDLDLMLTIISDRVNKSEYLDAYNRLKQLVFITIDQLVGGAVNASTDSATYNQLQNSYQLPSINKLEDLYQLVRMKSQEILRGNQDSKVILELSSILSILQQVRYLLLNRKYIQQQQQQIQQQSSTNDNDNNKKIVNQQIEMHEEDEGLQIYCQYQSKMIQMEIQPVEFDRYWQWNSIILEKNRKYRLKQWDISKLAILLHNQSSMYLDQIYTILLDRIKDQSLLNSFTEANSKLEDLIIAFEFNQPMVDSYQYLLAVDELLNGLSAISEISFKYSSFILDHSSTSKIIELNSLKSRVQEIMNHYISLETQYFQLSFSVAIYLDDVGHLLKLLKYPGIAGTPQSNLLPPPINKTIKDIETSSKIDDIFFVFRKVVSRSLASLSSPSVCATINVTSSNFDSIFIPVSTASVE